MVKVVSFLVVILLLAGSCSLQPDHRKALRERHSINDGWAFMRYGSGEETDRFVYDVRPAVTEPRDDKVADARPTAVVGAVASGEVLKPWILPSGNAFITDPDSRHERPDGNPGKDFPFVQHDFDDSSWERVDLPHDWAITGPFLTGRDAEVGGGMGRLASHGVAWYRRQLDLPQSDEGKSIFLDIDGAMSYAMVWLNGNLVGGWPYGYNSFRLDLTPYVVPGGDNQLAIRLDNPPHSSRWYPGGGIYRNVWLVKTHPVHVAQWGTYITAKDITAASATLDIEVTIDNDLDSEQVVEVITKVYPLNGERGSGGSKRGAGDESGNGKLGIENVERGVADGKRGDSKRGSGYVERGTGKSGGDGEIRHTEAAANFPVMELQVPAGGTVTTGASVMISDPLLWGPPPTQHPHLYMAVSTVYVNGEAVDSYKTRFGIRELEFYPDSGLLVNGEHIRFQGVNQHHDLGALGAAFNTRAAERQLEILREMGCNAIRMAHNPPAPELLELTDRMGFLVIDEIFDVWARKKTPLDFHLVFPDWYEQDTRSFVRRDRNCPSVIAWSFGNEVGEQYTGEEGAAWGATLRDIVTDEDPTRPTTASMNFARPGMPFPEIMDVISLNYQGEGIRDAPAYDHLRGIRTSPLYPAFREAYPGKVIISSETASTLSTRGTYVFPVHEGNSAPAENGSGGDPETHFVSAYELYTAQFGASPDKVFASQDRHPYVAGEFVWSGWDYLGEPTPYYLCRSSYCGIIDLAGFKKDRFYLYQSRWRPDFPMAHILPHWNWPERTGQVTPVHVVTSGDEAELFLNGVSQGRKKKGPFEYRLRWDDVVYTPGELEVQVYKEGVEWTHSVLQTTGAPSALFASADRNRISSDGKDLSFITVKIIDENGNLVPDAGNLVEFNIEGPGELLATDNGSPCDMTSFASAERRAFSGLVLGIVRSVGGKKGTIKITVSAEGLTSSVIEVRSN